MSIEEKVQHLETLQNLRKLREISKNSGNFSVQMIDEEKQVGNRRQLLWLSWWLLITLLVAQAEHLPVKTYTTADSLPRDDVINVNESRAERVKIWPAGSLFLPYFAG